MHIAKPCHEIYEGMSASTDGRHCEVCSTTVVDFTKMSVGDIEAYFKSNAGRHICGRYKASQVGSDALYSRMLWAARHRIGNIRTRPFRVAMLAMVSVMFTLSSCIMGKRADPEAFKNNNDDPKDSVNIKAPADSTARRH